MVMRRSDNVRVKIPDFPNGSFGARHRRVYAFAKFRGWGADVTVMRDQDFSTTQVHDERAVPLEDGSFGKKKRAAAVIATGSERGAWIS
jgi:hypothetical protein